MKTIKATETFKIPGSDIIVKEGQEIEIQEKQLDEYKIARGRLGDILLQTIPARVHVDQVNVEYVIAAVDKPKIVQDGDLWWFQKSGKQNGILLNSKDVTSVDEQRGTMTIMTKSGLRYQVFH